MNNIEENNNDTPKKSTELICFKIIFLISFISLSIALNTNLTYNLFKKTNKIVINYRDYDQAIQNNLTSLKKLYDKDYRRYKLYEEGFNEHSKCNLLDPINIFNSRLKNEPIEICNTSKTKHICYKDKGYYRDIFWNKNGVLCLMENIVLDPSKFSQRNYVYKGPIDSKYKGFPALDKGFLSTNCVPNKIQFDYNKRMYESYFNSWDYDYNNENEELEELAPGKTVFFLSRNQDSPNLFHGNAEIINIISLLYLFNLSPEEVQLVIFSGIEIPNDPFHDMFNDIFKDSFEPIYLNNLKKKYKISKAVNVPMNWDTPTFIVMNLPKCNSTTRTYKLYNDFVDKYIPLTPYKDKFISDENSCYYPDKIIKNHLNGVNFTKIVTIQWRRVWPKNRKRQQRILGNAKELADKLSQVLPQNFLVRLIDTATLPYKDQISVMRSSDYFIGIHGAGLSLSVFLPKNSILQEIHGDKVNTLLTLMSALSGHVTYSDLIKNQNRLYKGNRNVFFDVEDFAKSVLKHMKDNGFL